jgi:hypothetical protein
MLRCLLAVTLALQVVPAFAVEPSEILPKNIAFDPAIPTPAKFFGFEVGERHLYHHQVVDYLKKLDAVSDRVTLQEYARTHGNRPLVLLTITSPENHQNIESIRRTHLQLCDPKESKSLNVGELPVVVNMGYGVHGNEPSAINVTPLVAYYLAAGKGEEHEKLLKNTVILLDPCINPDGNDRFANWANDHRGVVLNSDPEHREHREPWPTGRVNYYWFDLNRDWMPVQQPESQGRMHLYHQWKPNLVLDFHEMGSSSTYFFQPGAPKQTHPLVPKKNIELTRALSKFHGEALDKIGSLYFTEERFDDFYPGKGSTYPDLHGAVGILFEQASSRGHVQDTPNGKLTFPFTIRNQFTTSLSSLKGVQALRREFLEHQRDFYRETLNQPEGAAPKGYVFAAPEGDAARLRAFLEILRTHSIRVDRLEEDFQVSGVKFPKDRSYVVPWNQPEFRFARVLFDPQIKFEENLFYDISAWSLPHAFNLKYAPLERLPVGLAESKEPPVSTPRFEPAEDDLAYVIDWRGYFAPKALAKLLAAGVKVRVAQEPFKVDVRGQAKSFAHGTLMVPIGIQPTKRKEVVEILRAAAGDLVEVWPVRSGITPEGIDLGSNAFVQVPNAKILLVTGEGTVASEAGEAWHLLDTRVRIPVTMVDASRLSTVGLEKYSVVILPGGTYNAAPAAAVESLKQYLTKGGTVVALGTSVTWLNSKEIASVKVRSRRVAKEAEARETNRRPYAAAEDNAAYELISGAIFETKVDPTHPVGYGFADGETLPVCRTNRVILEPSANPYSTPVLYQSEKQEGGARAKLLNGYVSQANQRLLAGSASAVVAPVGTGRVIALADDPNFRSFWYGTNRLMFNAVFFGPLVRIPPE